MSEMCSISSSCASLCLYWNHECIMIKFDQATRTAVMATGHCLIGCGIGEVLGMVLTSSPHRKAGSSIVVSIVLAFIFGYALSLLPLLRSGMGFRKSLK